MQVAAALVLVLLCVSSTHSYQLTQDREEMLAYYYANIDGSVPKTARMLMGEEKVNVYIGGKTIGLETKGGQLYSFELYAIEKPDIEITVSDGAAEKISKGEIGIIRAIESGGIRIKANNMLSAFKVEVMKRIYAASGADRKISENQKRQAESYGSANSIYIQGLQKTRIKG